MLLLSPIRSFFDSTIFATSFLIFSLVKTFRFFLIQPSLPLFTAFGKDDKKLDKNHRWQDTDEREYTIRYREERFIMSLQRASWGGNRMAANG